VLYEMLTGTHASDGDNVADTVANVLKTEPDWKRVPADTARSVHRLRRRSIDKDRRRRRADIAESEAHIEFDGPPGITRSRAQRRLAWTPAAAAIALGVVARRQPVSIVDPHEMRVDGEYVAGG
jgi:hypothetical protein